jgi:hypothetical protein
MSRYSHIFRGQDSEAIEKFPDLSLPNSQAQSMKKTETYDIKEENTLPFTSLFKRKKTKIITDWPEIPAEEKQAVLDIINKRQ